MKILLTAMLFLLASGCAQYKLVPVGKVSIGQVEKDMQDYACREHRGVKRYTEAAYVPCNARDIWMEWEGE